MAGSSAATAATPTTPLLVGVEGNEITTTRDRSSESLDSQRSYGSVKSLSQSDLGNILRQRFLASETLKKVDTFVNGLSSPEPLSGQWQAFKESLGVERYEAVHDCEPFDEITHEGLALDQGKVAKKLNAFFVEVQREKGKAGIPEPVVKLIKLFFEGDAIDGEDGVLADTIAAMQRELIVEMKDARPQDYLPSTVAEFVKKEAKAGHLTGMGDFPGHLHLELARRNIGPGTATDGGPEDLTFVFNRSVNYAKLEVYKFWKSQKVDGVPASKIVDISLLGPPANFSDVLIDAKKSHIWGISHLVAFVKWVLWKCPRWGREAKENKLLLARQEAGGAVSLNFNAAIGYARGLPTELTADVHAEELHAAFFAWHPEKGQPPISARYFAKEIRVARSALTTDPGIQVSAAVTDEQKNVILTMMLMARMVFLISQKAENQGKSVYMGCKDFKDRFGRLIWLMRAAAAAQEAQSPDSNQLEYFQNKMAEIQLFTEVRSTWVNGKPPTKKVLGDTLLMLFSTNGHDQSITEEWQAGMNNLAAIANYIYRPTVPHAEIEAKDAA